MINSNIFLINAAIDKIDITINMDVILNIVFIFFILFFLGHIYVWPG